MARQQTPLPPVFAGPRDEDLYKCVHCGLCLNACPTYLETGLETESPRGRIALMKAVREDRVSYTKQVTSHMDLCLQCRACEVVCPSGVPFGRLMEATREEISEQKKAPLWKRFALNLAFRHLLSYPGRLYALGAALRLYQRTGLPRLLRRVPGMAGRFHRQLPDMTGRFFKPQGDVAAPRIKARARVVLLSGCVMPMTHGSTMEAAVRVLSRNGCEVAVPQDQVCCGALNLHGGDRRQAQSMARRNIDVFLKADVDAVVVASAGCGSTMKEYDDLLHEDPEYAEKAQALSAKVKDISEFLVGLPWEPPKGKLPVRVTYQDACHLAHAQRITEAPRLLLQSIPGLQLVEMEASSRCCGAAGLYSTLQPEMSRQLQRNKVLSVLATGSEVMATANPGCAIQMETGLREAASQVTVSHVIDLLDQAYALE